MQSNLSQLILDKFESALLKGQARWIADLTEFFRDYKVEDSTFNLYATGRTRNKGLFLSRFFAWTALPNYSVSLFMASENGTLTVDRLRQNLESVSSFIRKDELQWAWLIVLSGRELAPATVSFVSRYDRREIGLAVASIQSAQLVCSQNQLGKSIAKHLGLRKLMEKSIVRDAN